jgi:hypothetical protein
MNIIGFIKTLNFLRGLLKGAPVKGTSLQSPAIYIGAPNTGQHFGGTGGDIHPKSSNCPSVTWSVMRVVTLHVF